MENLLFNNREKLSYFTHGRAIVITLFRKTATAKLVAWPGQSILFTDMARNVEQGATENIWT
jgi:hypothetical protein